MRRYVRSGAAIDEDFGPPFPPIAREEELQIRDPHDQHADIRQHVERLGISGQHFPLRAILFRDEGKTPRAARGSAGKEARARRPPSQIRFVSPISGPCRPPGSEGAAGKACGTLTSKPPARLLT